MLRQAEYPFLDPLRIAETTILIFAAPVFFFFFLQLSGLKL